MVSRDTPRDRQLDGAADLKSSPNRRAQRLQWYHLCIWSDWFGKDLHDDGG
jgi:hypothetical protein